MECKWNNVSCFEDEEDLGEKHSKKITIMRALYEHEDDVLTVDENAVDDGVDEDKLEEERKLKEAKERQEALKEEVKELEAFLEKIRLLNVQFFDEQEDALYEKEHQHDSQESTEV